MSVPVPVAGAGSARRSTLVVLVGLVVGALVAFGLGFSPAAGAAPPGSSSSPVVREATDEQKIKAASAIGANARNGLSTWLAYSDQNFVRAVGRQAVEGSELKAAALAALLSADENAPADFITTGIFAALKADTQKEAAASAQRMAQRTAALTIGITDDAELERLSKQPVKEFVQAVWRTAASGSEVWAAADRASTGTDADMRKFVTVGVFTARDKDNQNAKAKQTAAEKAAATLKQEREIRAAALRVTLGVEPSQYQLGLSDREVIGEIKDKTSGTQVRIAATHAYGNRDPQAWRAFLTSGVHEARERDRLDKEARDLKDALTRTQEVRDAAKRDGYLPTLAAAAQKVLDTGTLGTLTEFLHKGQHEAAKADIIRPTGGRIVQLQGTQSGRCLQVAGVGDQALANQASTELWDCFPNALKELWELVDRGKGQYALKNVNSKKCLDIPGAPTNSSPYDNNARVVQHDCHFGANQLWEFQQNDDGVVELRNVMSGKVLTAKDSGTGNATLVVQYTNLHAGNQEWRVIDPTHTADAVTMKTGKIQLTGVESKRCLQVAGLDADAKNIFAGTEIWDCARNAPKEQWELIDKGENKYVLRNVHSGKCLDPKYSDPNAGVALIQFDCHMTAGQQWTFVKSTQDSYRIRNVYTGKYIDVLGNRTHNGAGVVQWDQTGFDNQHWKVSWL